MRLIRLRFFVVLLGAFAGLLAPPAQAKVFRLSSETLAGYFAGSAGWLNHGSDPFAGGLGTQVDSSGSNQYLGGGEIGLSFNLHQAMTIRLAAELLSEIRSGEITGDQSGGSTRYLTLNSEVFVFNPKVVVEIAFSHTEQSRWYGFVSTGLADIQLENQVTMTTAGSTDLGVSSYSEQASQIVPSYTAGAGYEFLLVDNVTLSIEAGYRVLSANELNVDADAVTLAGSITEGSRLDNANGDPRPVNLDGVFAGLVFRFYFGEL